MPAHLTHDSESSSPQQGSILRSPKASEGQGGALGEAEALRRGNTVGVRDQIMDLVAGQGLKVSRAADNDLMPTPKARDSQPEGYEAGLRRATPQVGTIVKALVDGDERFDLMPTPTLGHIRNYDEPIDDYLERRQDFIDGKTKGMPGVSLGVAVRMEQQGIELMPTPNTMEHREIKSPEQIAALKEKSPGGYRNLREEVIHNLPTPTTRDFKDGQEPHERDGVVQTDTVARAVFNSGEVTLIGTPRATASESSSSQVADGASKGRIEDQVLLTNWGKFEPAIRRWEATLGRTAPAPTQPDGKDGAHRLSPWFTEWMMGLPEGWICDPEIGLTRNEQLKACGNGVVPQQAELALRILLDGVDLTKSGGGQVNLPTPTVSDIFTDNLASTQQKEGSMHSVTLPQAVKGLTNG